MTGADYIAQVRLTTKSGDVLAMPGETCDRVPASSLHWLVEQGLIKTAARVREPFARERMTISADDVGVLDVGDLDG